MLRFAIVLDTDKTLPLTSLSDFYPYINVLHRPKKIAYMYIDLTRLFGFAYQLDTAGILSMRRT